MLPVREGIYAVVVALIQALLKWIELSIVAPVELDTRPLFIFAVQYELLIAALGLLCGAAAFVEKEQRGDIVWPLVGSGSALILTYVLLGVSVREWMQGYEIVVTVLAVGIPDLLALVALGWSIIVVRRLIQAVE